MKLWKILGALLVSAALGGAAFGAAATLNVNGGNLQAGSALVQSCQTHTIKTSYGTHFFDPGVLVVDSATASNLDAACLGHNIHLVLTKQGGGFLDLGSKIIFGSSVTFLLSGKDLFLASALTDVHMAIN